MVIIQQEYTDATDDQRNPFLVTQAGVCTTLPSAPRSVLLRESELDSFSRKTARLTIQEFPSFIKIHKHILFYPEEH